LYPKISFAYYPHKKHSQLKYRERIFHTENKKKRIKYMAKVESLEKQGTCFFIGRLAEYKYYNMDQVIAAAMHKVDKILSRY